MKKLCYVLAMLPIVAYAQENQDTTKIKELDPVVISADKFGEKKSEIPYMLEYVGKKTIEFQNSQNTGDLMMNTGAVFVQKSQQGGSSCVLRGFEASRVLLVVDGVRMNNAIYRAGHLQDIITIDQSMLDHAEVLFGPSSTLYGSDALGGVMVFYTKKPLFGDDTMLVKANTSVRYSSANNEMTGHLDLNLGWKKIASLTSFNYSNFGDVRSGNFRDAVYDQYFVRNWYVETVNGADSMMDNPDRNIQVGSAYSQYDLMQKFAWKLGDKVTQTLNFQYSNSSDVPRYDRLTDMSGPNPKWAEWYYGPQTRMLTSLNTDMYNDNGKAFNKMSIILSMQNISQDRITRRFRKVYKNFQEETVNVYALNADFMKKLNEKSDIHYGLEFTDNLVESVAHTTDISTGKDTVSITRYPNGGSSMMSYAAYVSYKNTFSEKLNASIGLRYSGSSISANFEDTTFFPFPFKEITQKNGALTWSAGLVYKPNEKWRIALNNSSGYRAPNIDDLTKVFESTPGMLIVPNPDLAPEKVINTELTLENVICEKVRTSVTGWYSMMTNTQVVKDFTYNGSDSVLYDGSMSAVMATQNANDAMIQGVTGTVLITFDDNWSLKSTATYTYGRYHDEENDTIVPLDHIPPAFGQTSLMYSGEKFQAEFYARYNGWKDLRDYSPSGEDNLGYATPFGMPSWVTLNAKTNFVVTKNLSVNMGLENILDNCYRHFASGINAPGRNFFITLRGRF